MISLRVLMYLNYLMLNLNVVIFWNIFRTKTLLVIKFYEQLY
jgi:hypothetical protein